MCPESGRPNQRDYSFPKANRLLKRRQFLAMSDRSIKPDLKIRAGVFLVIGRANGLTHSRVGVTVTRKVGSAVTRNIIKRQVRELFRLDSHRWPVGLDFVFVARPEAGARARVDLRADLALAGNKIAAWSFPSSKDGTSGEEGKPARATGPSPKKDVPVSIESSGDFISFLLVIPERLALGFIFLYQRLISPFLPPACRFWPSCSNYAASALKIHGFWRGSYLAARRLLKCHPLHPGGYDPVPPRKEKDRGRLSRVMS